MKLIHRIQKSIVNFAIKGLASVGLGCMVFGCLPQGTFAQVVGTVVSPPNPTVNDEVTLTIWVENGPLGLSTPPNFEVVGSNVVLTVVGVGCAFFCSVPLDPPNFIFRIGRLPAGNFSVLLKHYDGIGGPDGRGTLISVNTMVPRQINFTVRPMGDIVPSAGPHGVPLSTLFSLLLIPPLVWMGLRRRRKK